MLASASFEFEDVNLAANLLIRNNLALVAESLSFPRISLVSTQRRHICTHRNNSVKCQNVNLATGGFQTSADIFAVPTSSSSPSQPIRSEQDRKPLMIG